MLGQTTSQLIGESSKEEKVNIMLKTNQYDYSLIEKVTVIITYTNKVESFTWEGSEITVDIPDSVEYTISFSSLSRFIAPESLTYVSKKGNVRSVVAEYLTTKIIVTLQDNQNGAYGDVISGKYVTISSNSVSGDKLSNGQSTYIPTGETVNISWPDISGYLSPTNSTSFITTGSLIEKAGLYQTCIQPIQVNGVESSDSFTITIKSSNGTVLSTQTTTGLVYHKIPFGYSYQIIPNNITGYQSMSILPSNSEYYSGSALLNNTVTVTYEKIPLGIFIQATDGSLIVPSSWSSSLGKTANGVAVLTENHKFVIALSESTSKLNFHDIEDSPSKTGLALFASESTAITDITTGRSNTITCTNTFGSSISYAPGYCVNYTFPNGRRGYLGTAGEWQIAYNNKSAIDSAMNIVGGTAIQENWHYTSTLKENVAYFWHIHWTWGSWLADRNNGDYYVRAFTEVE